MVPPRDDLSGLVELFLVEPGSLPRLPQIAPELALLTFQSADVFSQLIGCGVGHGAFLQNGKGRTDRGVPIRPGHDVFGWQRWWDFGIVGERPTLRGDIMDYKRTTTYRIGLASTTVGVILVLVYAVEKYLADLDLGAFAFLIRPQVPFWFLLLGFILTSTARRHGLKQEAEDQAES
jgi:hypothetical protein